MTSAKTTFINTNPVFASADVARDVDWYTKKLGFSEYFNSGDDPLNYAGIRREGIELHFQYQFPDDMWASDLRIQVKNIKPLFHELLEKGVVKEDGLRLQTAWGTNEFGLFDLNGNRIHFYEDC